jgi:hypothetical protein
MSLQISKVFVRAYHTRLETLAPHPQSDMRAYQGSKDRNANELLQCTPHIAAWICWRMIMAKRVYYYVRYRTILSSLEN